MQKSRFLKEKLCLRIKASPRDEDSSTIQKDICQLQTWENCWRAYKEPKQSKPQEEIEWIVQTTDDVLWQQETRQQKTDSLYRWSVYFPCTIRTLCTLTPVLHVCFFFFYRFPSCSQHACMILNSPKKIQSCLHSSVLALNHRSWLAVATCPNGLGYCPTNLALLFFQPPEAAAN